MSCYFSVNHEQKPLTAIDGKKRDKSLKNVCSKYFKKQIGLDTVTNCQFLQTNKQKLVNEFINLVFFYVVGKFNHSYPYRKFIPVNITNCFTLGEYNPYESNEQDSHEIAPTNEGLSAIPHSSPKKEEKGIK